jgi:ABC-type bacteriocin/lantibiotic exporter with double-glycine peptidase domain
MSECAVEGGGDDAMAAVIDALPLRPFGWAWVWRSLWLRKWQLVSTFALTIAVYAAGLVLPICTQRAVDLIAAGQAGSPLIGLGMAAIVAIGVEASLISVREKVVIRLTGFLERRISRRAFLHLMRRRIDLGVTQAGEVLNRFQQAGKIPAFLLRLVPRVVFDAGNAVVSLLVMFYYDVAIGLAILATALVSAFVMRNRVGEVRALAEQNFKATGKRQGVLSETVTGIVTVKALALEAQRCRQWNDATDAAIAASQMVADQGRRFVVSLHAVVYMINLMVLALGCYRILQHDLTFGGLLALQLLAGRLIAPIVSSGDVIRQYQETRVAITELGRFMAEPREHAAVRPPVRQLGDGGIAVKHLSLSYAPSTRPALDDVSFTLPARGRFALVGRNGSGKSSLIRVLLGLQRGYTGEIMLGGHNLRHYDPRALRAQTGIVDQDTILFSGTICENVMAGARFVDNAEIKGALVFAGALDFVEVMPQGLDSAVLENGRNFSGGQRQRLAIARAVVRNPRLVLLDEPSAFLDAEAAVALEQRLATWGSDRLLILVTHHLAAARSADAILVLDQGRLVGYGSHTALLRDCGPYAALWSDYSRSMEGELVDVES